MENEHRRGSATTIAFLLGAVAGGITALLLAPQTGADMRRRLRRGAHDLEEKAGSVAGAVKGAASVARTTYRDELERRAAAPATEPKRFVEPETVGSKPRTSVPA